MEEVRKKKRKVKPPVKIEQWWMVQACVCVRITGDTQIASAACPVHGPSIIKAALSDAAKVSRINWR
jgi:hypothetical protein